MKKSLFLLLLCSIFNSELHSQEIRYIRDILYVPLRSGQTLQHRIVHKGLVSGTRLTVLETQEESGYSLVHTDRGIEGWVQTQYLSPEPAARQLYQKAQQTIATLKQKNINLSKQFTQQKNKEQQAQKKFTQLTSEYNVINKELEDIKKISTNAITLNTDNKQLLEENQHLKNEVDILIASNQRLQEAHENDSFINGALAVLLGVIVTLLIPRLWPKRNSEWA